MWNSVRPCWRFNNRRTINHLRHRFGNPRCCDLLLFIGLINVDNRACAGRCVWYLRPVSGCINAGCAAGAAVATAGFGLLTFVLLLANSSRMVCGMSGSNRTPCCEQPRALRRSDIMTRDRSAHAPIGLPTLWQSIKDHVTYYMYPYTTLKFRWHVPFSFQPEIQ